jgi:hypothetical protein
MLAIANASKLGLVDGFRQGLAAMPAADVVRFFANVLSHIPPDAARVELWLRHRDASASEQVYAPLEFVACRQSCAYWRLPVTGD